MNQVTQKTAPQDTDHIIVSVTNGIARIALNRPEVRNAINDKMRAELIGAFEWADSAQEVTGVILTGEGKGFCSGGDVGGMRARLDAPAGSVAFNGWKRQKQTHRGVGVIYNMSKPVVAAVNGAAFGLGLDMALACDFIVAAEGSKLSMSFIKRGLVSDGGGMYFLPRRVGLARAKELILTGRVVETSEALAIGMVDRVVSPEALQAHAQTWAEELSHGSPTAVALTKSILGQSLESTADEIFKLGREAQAICYTTAEHRMSVEAFLNKTSG